MHDNLLVLVAEAQREASKPKLESKSEKQNNAAAKKVGDVPVHLLKSMGRV
jgi:hypothetical protein